jgi:hypothetical protein
MKRREAGLPDASETEDMFENSKWKPEKLDDVRVAEDSGDMEDVDAVDGDIVVDDEAANAVFRRRSEVRGWREWNREDVIVLVVECVSSTFVV